MKIMNWKSNGSINEGFWKDQNDDDDELDYEPVVSSQTHLSFMDDISDDNLSTNFKEIPDTSHLQNSVIDSDEEAETISYVTNRSYQSSSQYNRSLTTSENLSKYPEEDVNLLSTSNSTADDYFDKNAAAPILASREIEGDDSSVVNFTIKVKNATQEPSSSLVVEDNPKPKQIQQKCKISMKYFDQFSTIGDEDEELPDANFSDDSNSDLMDTTQPSDEDDEDKTVLISNCTFWKEKCNFNEIVSIKLNDNVFKYTPIDYDNIVHNLDSQNKDCLESATVSSATDSVFKVPSLINVPKRKQIRPIEEEVSSSKEDDVVSMIGSEVSESNQEDELLESVSMIENDGNSNNQLPTSTSMQEGRTNPSLNENRIRLLDNEVIENPNLKIKYWLKSMDNDQKNKQQRPLDTAPKRVLDIHKTIFRNCICYKHFIHKNCFKECPRNHGQNKGQVVWNLERADEETIQFSYDTMRHNDALYQAFYTCFVNEYITRNYLCDIITILIDSFFIQGVKPLAVFEYVIKLLDERSVMKFEDAIDYIIMQIGLHKQPLLLDIILQLIGSQKDLSDDWDILKRITLGCTVELRPELIESIINNAVNTYPMKLNICRQIQSIIDRKLIDLSKFPAELVKTFENLARYHNLSLNNPLPVRQRSLPRSISTQSSNSSHSNVDYLGLNHNSGSSNNGSPMETENASPKSSGANSGCSNKSLSDSNINCRQLSTVGNSPVFGELKLTNYDAQNRLHYHLKESVDKTEMQDEDIRKLDQILGSCNGQGFLYFLNKYRNEQTVITHFIGMTVAQLKSQKNNEIESLLQMLSIAESSDPNLFNDPKRSALIEVISLNILVERGLVNNCSFQLLKLFPDWDTLCTSQLLGKIRLSHMGKYIFILKILVRNSKFQLAFQMLTDENLKLLHHSSQWPYDFTAKIDIESRNKVLDKFFQTAFRKNADLVIDLYRIVFEGRNISEYDATVHINYIFRCLIEENNLIVLKKFNNHIDMFHTYLDKNIFRAYVVMLFDSVSEAEKCLLYEKGVLKRVYKYYNGTEKEVIIRTDMHNNEIYLILKSYLNHLSMQSQKSGFQIVIQAADWSACSFYQNNITKNCRSVSDINSNLIVILQRDFNITVQKCDNSAYLVVTDKEVYQYFQNCY